MDQSWYICAGPEVTTFRKFWARSAKWGKIGGSDDSCGAGVFLSLIPDDFLETSQWLIFTKFGHETWICVPSKAWFFYFRSHFPPKTSLLQGVKQAPHSHLIIEGGQRGTSLTPAQGTHCREMLITPHCRPNSREFPRSDNLLYNVWFRSYGPTKVPNFRIFAYFSYTKRLKIPFCVRSTAQGLHRRMLPVIPCSSRRPKGVLFASVVFLQLMVGELETLKNAQILAYGKCLNIYTVLLHGASDWTKDGWKRVIVSKDVPFGGLNYATTHCFSRWTLLC